MNKILRKNEKVFEIEDLSPYMDNIEEYYLTQIKDITKEQSEQLLEMIKFLTIKYLKKFVSLKKAKNIFVENLADENFDALFDAGKNVIEYDKNKLVSYIKNGDLLDIIFVFMHEASHYIQYNGDNLYTYSEETSKMAEPPLHISNIYNEAISSVVVPFLNKVSNENFSPEIHKFWFDWIFENNKYNSFVANFYLSNSMPLTTNLNNQQLLPTNISYRKVYFEKEADEVAYILVRQISEIMFSLMNSKRAKQNLLTELNDEQNHLSEYFSFKKQLSNSHVDFYEKLKILEPKDFLLLIEKLQQKGYSNIVEFIIAIYYSGNKDKKLDKFENLAKNNLLVKTITSSFNEDINTLKKCLNQAVNQKNYEVLSTKESILSVVDLCSFEKIQTVLNLYIKNLDLNAFFMVYEYEEPWFGDLKNRLFTPEKKQIYAKNFLNNFIEHLQKINSEKDVKTYVKIMTNITSEEGLKEIISWFNGSQKEKNQIIEKIDKLKNEILKISKTFKSKGQPGD